ncbi:lytic murein transglycosylase [Mesorhizobium sp. WSM3860]|nr:lytic murein transglycosylase [Mesorhizobium sp. WSM3860]
MAEVASTIAKVALHGAPLCPAGHLPHEGGDRMSRRLSPTISVAGSAAGPKLPISPLVGEMSGRCPNRIDR